MEVLCICSRRATIFTARHASHDEANGGRSGHRINHSSANDAYLDMPEFDAEFISFNDYHGHIIPALETVSSDGSKVLAYKPVAYEWLEAVGGNYGIARVTPKAPIGGARQVFEVELK